MSGSHGGTRNNCHPIRFLTDARSLVGIITTRTLAKRAHSRSVPSRSLTPRTPENPLTTVAIKLGGIDSGLSGVADGEAGNGDTYGDKRQNYFFHRSVLCMMVYVGQSAPVRGYHQALARLSATA